MNSLIDSNRNYDRDSQSYEDGEDAKKINM